MRKELCIMGCLGALGVGCGDTSQISYGAFTEPMQVHYRQLSDRAVRTAQFFRGKLPEGTEGPIVYALQSKNNAVRPGETGWPLAGSAQKGSAAVAMAFDDIGTGY